MSIKRYKVYHDPFYAGVVDPIGWREATERDVEPTWCKWEDVEKDKKESERELIEQLRELADAVLFGSGYG